MNEQQSEGLRQLIDIAFPTDRNDSVVDPSRGDLTTVPPTRRGTTNGNARGGSDERRRRREWLVETFRADVDMVIVPGLPVSLGGSAPYTVPSCRCYRCGTLLTVDTVTVDRVIPGCQGGTYRRSNIRPACGRCNSVTGATTRRKK